MTHAHRSLLFFAAVAAATAAASAATAAGDSASASDENLSVAPQSSSELKPFSTLEKNEQPPSKFSAQIKDTVISKRQGDAEYYPQQQQAPHPQQFAAQAGAGYYQQQKKQSPPKQQQLQQQQQRPHLKEQRPRGQQQQQQQQRGPPLTSSEEQELLEEEQAAEPDRLTELLPQSKFTCGGKKDGYYADDGLNCEVFHYCQDGGKHSWLCPNQFAFHQIHLICVPPSSDNICKQSVDFHFVNDYLYKPVNEKEATQYNTSLKYADRFFPEGYSSGGAELQPYHEPDQRQQQQPRPQQQQQQQQQPGGFRFPPQRYQQTSSEEDDDAPPPRRQQQQQQQQFRQQKPFPSAGPSYQAQGPPQFRQQQQRPQQPHPQQYRTSPSNNKPVMKQPPTFFTNPESINIPLTNRRPVPQNFRPSPQLKPSF